MQLAAAVVPAPHLGLWVWEHAEVGTRLRPGVPQSWWLHRGDFLQNPRNLICGHVHLQCHRGWGWRDIGVGFLVTRSGNCTAVLQRGHEVNHDLRQLSLPDILGSSATRDGCPRDRSSRTVSGHQDAAADLVECAPICMNRLVTYTKGIGSKVPFGLVLNEPVTS